MKEFKLYCRYYADYCVIRPLKAVDLVEAREEAKRLMLMDHKIESIKIRVLEELKNGEVLYV